jgi:NAD(P)-dependent dehydrogenase (short-subunit alcohol dehydrogenase family)
MAYEHRGTRAMNPIDLSGKVALVTGGYGGIGFAAAIALANAGAAVAIWDVQADHKDAARATLLKAGQPVLADIVDVGDSTQVEQAFARVASAFGRVDCVFANAGIAQHAASFLDISIASRDAVLGVNLSGAWNTLQAGLRHMVGRATRGQGGGSLIANGSTAAFAGLAGGEHYGAAKAGLGAVVKGIAAEYGRLGIRANMICPGPVEKGGKPGRWAAKVAARNPIPRYGKPHEIAGMVVYLASDAASYHTGDIITVDGGKMANVF